MNSWFRHVLTMVVVATMVAAQTPVRQVPSRRAALGKALQAAATQALGGRQGMILVVDTSTGAVLAKAEHGTGRMILTAPGSAVKPFVLAELLRLRRVRPDEPMACRRTVPIANRNFDCTHTVTAEPMNATTALAYSCNSYFAEVATRLSAAELEDALRRSGIVSQYGSMADSGGRLQRASTPEQLRLQALGEYGIEVTPWSLAGAYRRLAAEAAGGRLPAAVRDGLLGATDYGMARLARSTGVPVAGKTGTSRAREGAWTHGWFAGYVPAETSTMVIVVYVERGQGRDAAEIAAKALRPLADGESR